VREPYRHFADGNKALLSNTTLAAAGSFRMHSPEQRLSYSSFHSREEIFRTTEVTLGTLVEAGGTPYHERQAQIGARFQF
jgi:hypothetical protein